VKLHRLFASLCLLGSISAEGQLTGGFFQDNAQLTARFFLDKPNFARGEPVFLYFRLANRGPDTVMIVPVNQEQPYCSGISISVSSDPLPTSSCPFLGGQGCNENGPLPVPRPLLAGETYVARFVLNFDHKFSAPGEYRVNAKHANSQMSTNAQAELTFRVNAEYFAPSQFQPWLDQLKSEDRQKRIEAARVLASLAPPSLEDTLLGFAANPETRRYAPLALYRLNTRRSIEALAHLVTEEPINVKAAQYLAETGDQRWYPLLRDAAVKNARISAYPAYAAELGGEKMLPVLVALAESPDTKFTRLNAVMAMGSTGSRKAIPLLLNQLKSPDINISDRASYALQLLTHRTAIQDLQNRERPAEYLKWSHWWIREGATALIYKDTSCGETIPLP